MNIVGNPYIFISCFISNILLPISGYEQVGNGWWEVYSQGLSGKQKLLQVFQDGK